MIVIGSGAMHQVKSCISLQKRALKHLCILVKIWNAIENKETEAHCSGAEVTRNWWGGAEYLSKCCQWCFIINNSILLNYHYLSNYICMLSTWTGSVMDIGSRRLARECCEKMLTWFPITLIYSIILWCLKMHYVDDHNEH